MIIYVFRDGGRESVDFTHVLSGATEMSSVENARLLIPTRSRTIRFELQILAPNPSFILFLSFYFSLHSYLFAVAPIPLALKSAVKNRRNNIHGFGSKVVVISTPRLAQSRYRDKRQIVDLRVASAEWGVLVGRLLTGILMKDFPAARFPAGG